MTVNVNARIRRLTTLEPGFLAQLDALQLGLEGVHFFARRFGFAACGCSSRAHSAA